MSSFRLISLFIVGALSSNIVQAIEPRQSGYRKNTVNGHLSFGVLAKLDVEKHPVADHKKIRSIDDVGSDDIAKLVSKQDRQKKQLSAGPSDNIVDNENPSGLAQFKKIDEKMPEDNVLLPSQLEEQVVGKTIHERKALRKAETVRRAKAMESTSLEIEQQRQMEAQPRRLLEQAQRAVVDQAEMARLRQSPLPRPVVARRPLPTLPIDATGRPGFAHGF